MLPISADVTADLFFQIKWHSGAVGHTDAYYARSVNFYRDLLPSGAAAALMNKQTGDQIELQYDAGQLIAESTSHRPLRLTHKQFDPHRISMDTLIPRQGRFYPKGLLRDVPGLFSVNREPFRCLDVSESHLLVDLNHPFCTKNATLHITVGAVEPKLLERGGTSRDWSYFICQGVGMQARWQNRTTDFFSDRPFARDDDKDSVFYEKPRFVKHLDETALDVVRGLHTRFLKNGMKVLDLMSSWQTHLPANAKLERLTGVGMNARELEKNGALTDWLVRDLNLNPSLPFDPESFDLVICTVSVEYLIHPFDVFREVARVLKPDGVFAVTFSNRCFPTKTIRIWTQSHEFERMGLVLEYFLKSECFRNLHSASIRGLDRPRNDKYRDKTSISDPVYAVWGAAA